MTAEELACVVRAVELSEQDVYDVRIVSDDKAGVLAVGAYKTIEGVAGLVLVHCPTGGTPCVMRLQGTHRATVFQMIGEVLEAEEE